GLRRAVRRGAGAARVHEENRTMTVLLWTAGILAGLVLAWVLFWRPLVRLCARAWGRSLFTLDGVDVRHAPAWFRLPGFRNAVATTLDRTILCKRIVQDPRAGPADVRLLRHEWHHVREWDRRGWRYLPVYLWRL